VFRKLIYFDAPYRKRNSENDHFISPEIQAEVAVLELNDIYAVGQAEMHPSKRADM
jgi:hypothetical protein